jgi:hypothetical protein
MDAITSGRGLQRAKNMREMVASQLEQFQTLKEKDLAALEQALESKRMGYAIAESVFIEQLATIDEAIEAWAGRSANPGAEAGA